MFLGYWKNNFFRLGKQKLNCFLRAFQDASALTSLLSSWSLEDNKTNDKKIIQDKNLQNEVKLLIWTSGNNIKYNFILFPEVHVQGKKKFNNIRIMFF